MIFVQLILTTRKLGKFIHGLLHNRRTGVIEGIHRLSRLEIDIRVLGCAANHRTVGSQSPLSVSHHPVIGNEIPQILIR